MNDRYESVILHFIARVFMVPLIIVFGVYVLLHGELSPGGGFQAGAIIAAALLLVRLALGNRAALRIPQGLLVWLACIGLGIYMFGGVLPLILGANFLDYAPIPVEWYNQFAGEHRTARAMGILIIEVGVFFGVAAVLVLIYDLITGSSRQ